MRKLTIWSLIGVACALLLATHASAEDLPKVSPVPDPLCPKLQALFKKYYPQGSFTNMGLNGIHFEYEVTTFEFPYTGPRGAKHMATTQRGPKQGGILCSVWLEKGKYSGQIALMPRPGKIDYGPYAFMPGNDQYELVIGRTPYTTLLMAPYSAKRDAHLWVNLSYPPDAQAEFLKEFRAIMEAFDDDAG